MEIHKYTIRLGAVTLSIIRLIEYLFRMNGHFFRIQIMSVALDKFNCL